MKTQTLVLAAILCLPAGALAQTARLTAPHGASRSSIQSVPATLRPLFYQSLARDVGVAYAIKRNDCAALPKQNLQACFAAGGVRFAGANAKPLTLHLAAWGRGPALHRIDTVKPAIAGNRASYVHGNITEWWRVLPVGFEQGFTIAKRPAGNGKLTLALAASRKAENDHGELTFGKLHYGELVVTDAAGKVVPATLSTKHGHIMIAMNDAYARYPLTVDPLVWMEQKVTANDPQATTAFGWSVALDGTAALVGEPFATIDGNTWQGAAYVFTESGGTWTQTQKLTAGDGAANDTFGTSVALDGTIALVGASGASVDGNDSGAAYVFAESSGSWTQTAKLTISYGGAGDAIGSSAALDGNTALLGAPFAPVNGNAEQGAAYVFEESGGTWSQTQMLTAGDGAEEDIFGWSVALDGTTALVGALGASVGGTYAQGAAYVFDDSGGTWTQTQKLTASDGAMDSLFGSSVALSGTTALIGARGATVGGNFQQGAAYIFNKTGNTWSQTQKLSADDGAVQDFFGTAVALSGTTALVGAYFATVSGDFQQGAAYMFDDSGNTWTQAAKLTASDGAAGDLFGYSVALSGITALAGAPYATVVGYGNYQGAAYFYTAMCPQGYSEHDGTLIAGGLFATPPYQAPAGLENGLLGGPGGFNLYAQYSNGNSQHTYRIPGNELHKNGPAGTYRWGVKAGSTGGNYVLCVLHP